ncbi:hypothetical protein H8356DRAFT_1038524 [Neocallimastix lanati (nom. inval.)]|nr:hypothetical protein H8356DRAFT_1038524 [Neocallimastix sp. JGI-2020a]
MDTRKDIFNSILEYFTEGSPFYLITEIIHNSFIIFFISSVIGLITIYRIYDIIIELLPVKVTCFYCNNESELTKPPKKQRVKEKWINGKPRCWWCRRCDNWNIINENGEIQDISEMENIENNVNQNNTKYCDNEEKFPINDYFCDTCKMHQEYIRQRLADYLPDEDDPDYERYLNNLPQFKTHLENKYPIVCENCQKRVKQELDENQYKYRDLKLLLENRKKNISYYKNIEGSFIQVSLFEKTFSSLKKYLKITVVIIVNSLCFILGLMGIYWLSILLLKCFLEPEVYGKEMISITRVFKKLINIINHSGLSCLNLNREFIIRLLKKAIGIKMSCSKLWKENKVYSEDDNNLIEEYLNTKNNEILFDCPRELWNNWFLICTYISCLFVFLSFIEYLKYEIMIKPIFKKTTNKAIIWPVSSFFIMNTTYCLWYYTSSNIKFFKFSSLVLLFIFLKVIWDFSLSTYTFISSTLQKPSPVIELKRTHSSLPGVVRNYDIFSNNNKVLFNSNESDILSNENESKNKDLGKKYSKLQNNEDENTESFNEEFSTLLEKQFRRQFSLSSPINHKYREKQTKKANKNLFSFSIKSPTINNSFDDELDEFDSDHDTILNDSFDLNDSSIFYNDNEVNNRIDDSPTKKKSDHDNMYIKKPVIGLPNYTYLNTKNKMGFFNQYNNNLNFNNLNKKNGSLLWNKNEVNNENNDTNMDTDKNLSNLNEYRNNDQQILFEDDISKSNSNVFGNLEKEKLSKQTRLTSYISNHKIHDINNELFYDSDNDNEITKNINRSDLSDEVTKIIQKSQKFFLPEESTGLEDILSAVKVSSPKKSWKHLISNKIIDNKNNNFINEKNNLFYQMEKNKDVYDEQYKQIIHLIKSGSYILLINNLIINTVLLFIKFISDPFIEKSIKNLIYFTFHNHYYLNIKSPSDIIIQLLKLITFSYASYLLIKSLWKFSKFEQILHLEKRYWMRKYEQKLKNKTFGAALQYTNYKLNIESNSSLLYNKYKPKIRNKIRNLLFLLSINNGVSLLFVQPILIINMLNYLLNLSNSNLKNLNIVNKILFYIRHININIYNYLAIKEINIYEFIQKLNIIYIVTLQFLPVILCILLIFTINRWVKLVKSH